MFQPSLKLFINDSFSFFSVVGSPFLTTAALITVKKNVQISIIRRSFTSLIPSRNPAITGEKRYLALPASDTNPLALENSSFVSRSVIVALYDGSRRAENTALTNTPIHISRRLAPPLSMAIKM